MVEDDPGFSVEVKAPSGRALLRARGLSVLGSGRLVRLPKDRIEQFVFHLNQIYNFDEIGTYQIVARRKVASVKPKQPFEVVSNPLEVTIVSER